MVKYTLKLCITGLSLGLLFVIIGREKTFESIAEADLKWLVLMYSVFVLFRIVQTFQLHRILQKVGISVSVVRVFFANALSALYALILPGDFIAIGVKWANLSAATGERALILNSILYNKLVLLVPPLLFGSVALTLENPFPEAAIGVSVIFLAILIFFMIFCLFSYRFGVLINRLFAKIIKLLPTFFQSKIAGLTNSLEMLRGLSFLDHSIILLISIISYVLSIIFFILGAKTIGLNVPISALIWIYSIIVFFVHLPITIGNLGVRESILITTLLNYGILPEKSFSFGLILFTNHILIALIGSGYQVALNLGWTRWKLIN